MEPDEPKLSHSDERILRALVGGDPHSVPFDWVALQHLKQKRLIEETPTGPRITDQGKRAIGALHGPGH